MTNAEELKSITALVKFILQNDIQARNSDSLLYLQFIHLQAEANNIDLNTLSVAKFLGNEKELGFANYKSVCRARRKVQQHYPHLAGCRAVKAGRSEQEEEFKEYSRGIL